jgi:ClpP class serine protease
MRQRFAPSGLCAIDPKAFGLFWDMPSPPENEVRGDGTVVVSIRGPLEHHEGWCDSYDAIGLRVLSALDANPKAIVLSIDSPGGLVAGCFETATEIRRLCADAGVPLYAYVDGQCTSAAFALACAASRIAIPPSGMVGSVGVIAEVKDARAQAAMFGVQVTLLTSGARKADGHPMNALDNAAEAALQKQVDNLARVFFEHVASSRGLSVEAIAALEGGQSMGADAVATGLADVVMTRDAMLTAVAAGEFEAPAAEGDETMFKASKQYEEAIAALRKAAEGDDEEAAKAKRMLKAELAEDEMPRKEPDGDEGKADDEMPEKKEAKGKAKAEDAPTKKDDEDGDEAKAIAKAVTARLDKFEAEQKAAAIAAERAQLLASRPDLEAELRTTLAKASTPIETVRDVVKSLPKRAVLKPAAASMAGGTRGEGQSDANTSHLSPDEAKALDERMGLVPAGKAPHMDGVHQRLPVMTRAAARIELEKREHRTPR